MSTSLTPATPNFATSTSQAMATSTMGLSDSDAEIQQNYFNLSTPFEPFSEAQTQEALQCAFDSTPQCSARFNGMFDFSTVIQQNNSNIPIRDMGQSSSMSNFSTIIQQNNSNLPNRNMTTQPMPMFNSYMGNQRYMFGLDHSAQFPFMNANQFPLINPNNGDIFNFSPKYPLQMPAFISSGYTAQPFYAPFFDMNDHYRGVHPFALSAMVPAGPLTPPNRASPIQTPQAPPIPAMYPARSLIPIPPSRVQPMQTHKHLASQLSKLHGSASGIGGPQL